MRVSVIDNKSLVQKEGSKILTSRYVDYEVDCDELLDLGALLEEHHVVLGTFKDRIKTNENLIQSCAMFFDYDANEIDMETLHHRLCDWDHLILTTQSHMKDKGNGLGAIPRFRLVIPFATPCPSSILHNATVRWFGQEFIKDIPNDRCGRIASQYIKKHNEGMYYIDNAKRPYPLTEIPIGLGLERIEVDIPPSTDEIKSDRRYRIFDYIIEKYSNIKPDDLKQYKSWKHAVDMAHTAGERFSAIISFIGVCKTAGIGQYDCIRLVEELKDIMYYSNEAEKRWNHKREITKLYNK
jgi:hypothetical protein